jgi:aminoglycoside phosphotransferase (APT) family kinase protein
VRGNVRAAEVLKYQRGRCSLRVTAADRSLHVKAYSAQRAVTIDLFEILEKCGLTDGRPPTVPPIVACDRELGLLVTRWLDGPNGVDLLVQHRGERAGAIAAAWLLAAAGVSIELGPLYGPDRALADVERWAKKVDRVDPDLGAPFSKLYQQLTATAPVGGQAALCHGDFSAEHVLDLGSGPGVIDWDSFRRGPLEFDAAKFVATMDHIALDRPDLAEETSAAQTALAAGASSLLDFDVLRWYKAVALAWLAKKLVREQPRPPRWQERATALIAIAASVVPRG